MQSIGIIKKSKVNRKESLLDNIKTRYQLYLLVIIPITWLCIFRYWPMYGVQIAFRDYSPTKGIWNSDFIGFDNFIRFFESYKCFTVIKNTFLLSFYHLIAGFPIPIIFALALNSTNKKRFAKIVQTVTYAPHFISTVVLVGIVMQFLSPRIGIVNTIIESLGGQAVDYMAKASAFRDIYVWSEIWKSIGWSSIIYLAALSSISPSLHEAAIVDGASRFKRVLHIDIPGIMPTVVILLIMNCGRIMNVGFEKAFLMQNSLNLRTSELISTYVYKVGLASATADFAYASAIGLFNSVINFILILSVNKIAKKVGNTSLW